MDIVYILGKGSKVNDLEIKYSLRSLEQHMIDIGKVFVIGECPNFLKNVIHIPVVDPFALPERNALAKINIACRTPEIDSEFILMNDDFFALEDFSANDLPFYAHQEGDGNILMPLDFALHVPYKINKEMWLACPFPEKTPNGFSMRSFYLNYYRAPAKEHVDPVVRIGLTKLTLDEQCREWSWFSTTDTIFRNPDFLNWIEKKYSTPSKYEN